MSSRILYYRSQIYTDEELIDATDALRSGTYVRAHVIDDCVDHAEIVDTGSMHHVVYYDRTWPDSKLWEFHQQRYGGAPLEVWGRRAVVSGGSELEVYEIDRDGQIARIVHRSLDDRGDPVREMFRDSDGTSLGEFRYEYADGELRRVTEIAPDGLERVLFEEE